jgi:hypothetical protein
VSIKASRELLYEGYNENLGDKSIHELCTSPINMMD